MTPRKSNKTPMTSDRIIAILENTPSHRIESPVGDVNSMIREMIGAPMPSISAVSSALKRLEMRGDIIRRKGTTKTYSIWLSKRYKAKRARLRILDQLPELDKAMALTHAPSLTSGQLSDFKALVSESITVLSKILSLLDDTDEKALLQK
jgi:DNA-binding MarR family transcriptional regulator